MDYITLYIVYGSHTDCFTLTRNTTWFDLCTSIQDRSGLPVTRLYHHNINGNIETLSCDGDLKSLVYGCNTSWLRLSIDSTETTGSPCSNSANNNSQQSGLGTTTIIEHDTSSQQDNTCFTTQFESFGKLMDKYSDLIQSNDDIKTMMHEMAIRLTLHQKPTVDLAEIEARLEKRLGNATTTGTNTCRSDIIDDHDITTNDQISLAFSHKNTPRLSCSTILSTSPSSDHVKRTPTAHNRTFDHPRTRSPSSYKSRRTVQGTIVGEWPAYSSLYPPPPHSIPLTRHDSSPSLALSLLDADIHHQKSPLSLYPQPPMTTTQSDRTSRSIPNRVSLAPRPSSFFAGMPLQSTMKPNAISNRSSTTYSNTSSSRNRSLHWNLDDSDRYTTQDPWQTSHQRQSYKEQHRALKSQQKELERTIRHLKRQEKLGKKEYRMTLQQYDNNDNDDALIRKSSSLSSLSSSTSASTSSSISDSYLQKQQQQQNDWNITCYVPPLSSSPSSSIDQRGPYSDIIVNDDDQYHYGLDSKKDRQRRWFGIDKISSSQDHGDGVTYLAGALDRLSANRSPLPL